MARPVVPRKAVLTPNPDDCTRVTLGKVRPKGAWGLRGRYLVLEYNSEMMRSHPALLSESDTLRDLF